MGMGRNNGLYGQAPNYAGGGMVPASYFGMGGGYSPQGMASGLGGLLGGMFGHSDDPYNDAMKQYQDYMGRAQGVQNPFLQAGTGAIGDYQKWLGGMSDPSGFINNMMGKYQQSPYAKYLTQQGMNAGINSASASGLAGSTPFAQQMQANAQGIASGDMQNWLQNALGVNSQYGAGQANLMAGGQNAANSLTGMYGQMGQEMGDAAYGRGAGRNQDFNNMLGGGLSLASMFL